MDEREVSELLSDLGADLRAPKDVRTRVWSLAEATLAGEETGVRIDTELGEDERQLSVSPLLGWDALPDMLIVPEDDGESKRRLLRGSFAAALAAAAVLIVVMISMSGRSDEEQTVFTDNTPGSLLIDPDAACGRFLDAPFDHGLYRGDGEIAGTIDPAMLMIAEEAFAQLRADFERSENSERVAELLGSGTNDRLIRIESLVRQAPLQSEQDDQGGARRTLQTIPSVAASLVEPGSLTNVQPCLGG